MSSIAELAPCGPHEVMICVPWYETVFGAVAARASQLIASGESSREVVGGAATAGAGRPADQCGADQYGEPGEAHGSASCQGHRLQRRAQPCIPSPVVGVQQRHRVGERCSARRTGVVGREARHRRLQRRRLLLPRRVPDDEGRAQQRRDGRSRTCSPVRAGTRRLRDVRGGTWASGPVRAAGNADRCGKSETAGVSTGRISSRGSWRERRDTHQALHQVGGGSGDSSAAMRALPALSVHLGPAGVTADQVTQDLVPRVVVECTVDDGAELVQGVLKRHRCSPPALKDPSMGGPPTRV